MVQVRATLQFEFIRPGTDSQTDDVANAWATSVSSRSVTYRQAMALCLVFEMTGALAVGARTASTIKNGMYVGETAGCGQENTR
jgi:phosphate/sulfate permease